jgi:F-type H+-transporting ATPase subunit gamma
MQGLRDLKKRKQTSDLLHKFARGMQILSSSKMALRQKDREKLYTYTEELRSLVEHALPHVPKEALENSPLLNPPKTNPRVIVLYFSDMGLCGSYNEDILSMARKLQIKNEDYIFVIGAMGEDILGRIGIKADGKIGGMYSDPDISTVSAFFMDILTIPLSQLTLIYIESEAGRKGKPKIENLLPLNFASAQEKKLGFQFIPNATDIVNEGAKMFIYAAMLRAFYTAAFSEFNMRWITMSRAEKQAKEMSHNLQVQISRIRGESITRELLDTIGGIIGGEENR